ncbi:Clp protease ClpP [Tuanshanicoccus lijuaniae]|uniref:head maturation protease, ClpP-related n=1 Tax=Aerococcaceae bacterium zg-1292 TaxID=2774330 RepID=UPI00193621D6|nr:Clp protease ClpP [Aerococcaceae bacterium zg-1292]QQA38050.1 Clp protease ClpP [Aerococcaceae bacterium zg-1292]
MRKFWNWKTNKHDEHLLFLNGTIAEESWFDDDVTPRLFKSELDNHKGDITVWINSPGGDCIAAAQIYNMLIDHKGEVVIKIDGIAASAASVIAMAGTKVLMSPVSMMMIHNPMTLAFGDKEQMKQVMSMLDEVKESIMNAYEIKTNLPRKTLSSMMDSETWMNVHKAIELGFCDGVFERETEDMDAPIVSNLYSKGLTENSLKDKLVEKCHIQPKNNTTQAQSLLDRLNLIKNWR